MTERSKRILDGWSETNRILKKMEQELNEFCNEIFDEDVIFDALYDFYCEKKPDSLETACESLLFLPWFWYSSRREIGFKGMTPRKTSPAQLYLAEHGEKHSAREIGVVEAACDTPLSFYRVVRVKPEIGVEVVDLLREKSLFIHEKKGSSRLHPGDIVFGLAVMTNVVNVFNGLSICAIPPDCRDDIALFQNGLFGNRKEITTGDLFDQEREILAFYHSLMERLQKTGRIAIQTGGDEAAGIPTTDDMDLVQLQEEEAKMAELLHAHWEKWIRTPLPILGGISPADAVQSESGRKKVEALLDDFEAKNRTKREESLKTPVRFLRDELKLSSRSN